LFRARYDNISSGRIYLCSNLKILLKKQSKII